MLNKKFAHLFCFTLKKSRHIWIPTKKLIEAYFPKCKLVSYTNTLHCTLFTATTNLLVTQQILMECHKLSLHPSNKYIIKIIDFPNELLCILKDNLLLSVYLLNLRPVPIPFCLSCLLPLLLLTTSYPIYFFSALPALSSFPIQQQARVFVKFLCCYFLMFEKSAISEEVFVDMWKLKLPVCLSSLTLRVIIFSTKTSTFEPVFILLCFILLDEP